MVGARLVEEVLASQRAPGAATRFEITVFGEEPGGNYNRILLSAVLAGRQDPRGIFLHPVTWYAENGVTLHGSERVTEISRTDRSVRSERSDGAVRATQYDRLVIATGSRPYVPPIEGSGKQGVFLFRTLDDCRRIEAYARGCRSAAVIGGGLLGLEAAHGLLRQGLEVHVIHQGPHLMDRQLDPHAGALLADTLEELGLRIHLNATTTALLGPDRVQALTFAPSAAGPASSSTAPVAAAHPATQSSSSSKTPRAPTAPSTLNTQHPTLPTDLVVIACGIQPNTELAVTSGLPVERAILVDDQLRTADPHVYALGECAQHRGRTYGLVAPLWDQARVLAQHLTGRRPDAAYHGSPVATRLKVAGVEVASMGVQEPEQPGDEVVQFLEPKRGLYKKLVIRDDRLIGAILVGDGERAPYLTQLFDRGGLLPAERARLLFDIGSASCGALSPAEMSDEHAVCHCNGVSKGEVEECLAGGAAGVHDVMRATRAGTGCGSCKTLLRALVDASSARRSPQWEALPLAEAAR
jgi:nitrite reductase (NADH) large subunit